MVDPHAEELIARLRAARRNTRPMAILAFLGILISFVVLVTLIETDRRKWKRLAEQLQIDIKEAEQAGDPAAVDSLGRALGATPQFAPLVDPEGEKPPQTPYAGIRVDIFHCQSSGPRAHELAQRAAELRGREVKARWRVRPLSERMNRDDRYLIDQNEIRYNADEQDAAVKLNREFSKALGVKIVNRFNTAVTPNYLTVFFCEDADPPLPEVGSGTGNVTE